MGLSASTTGSTRMVCLVSLVVSGENHAYVDVVVTEPIGLPWLDLVDKHMLNVDLKDTLVI